MIHSKDPWDFPALLRPSCLIILLLGSLSSVDADIACSRGIFGSPLQQNCANALSSLPRDEVVQYFVDQQLRPSPGMNWRGFADPRLPDEKQEIVQVPAWWSSGEVSAFDGPCHLTDLTDCFAKGRVTLRFSVSSTRVLRWQSRHPSGPPSSR